MHSVVPVSVLVQGSVLGTRETYIGYVLVYKVELVCLPVWGSRCSLQMCRFDASTFTARDVVTDAPFQLFNVSAAP